MQSCREAYEKIWTSCVARVGRKAVRRNNQLALRRMSYGLASQNKSAA